jgi:tetratricopeptide (TPR) repeat protein
MSYECNEEYEQAVDCYKKAIDNGADEEEMWQNIGDCYRYMENYSAAMEAYEHGEKREYNINCSEIAFAKGEYNRAEQLYKKTIFKLQAEISKASNYIGSGYGEKLGKLAEELGFKYVLFGDFYLEYFQDYRKAAACYDKAVYYDKSDESVWKAYIGKVKVYFMADKPKKARKCAEIAKAAFERLYSVTEEEFLVTAPYRAIYMGRFGWTYLGIGDTEKALYYFKEMDRSTLCANCKHHGCYEAQLFQGIVYYVLGDMDKAQQAFREAVKRNPHDVFSMKMLAKVEK